MNSGCFLMPALKKIGITRDNRSPPPTIHSSATTANFGYISPPTKDLNDQDMCQTGWECRTPKKNMALRLRKIIEKSTRDQLHSYDPCHVLTGHVGPMTRRPLLRLHCSAAAAALREKCVSELRRISKEVKPNDAASDKGKGPWGPWGPWGPMDQSDFGYFGPQMLAYIYICIYTYIYIYIKYMYIYICIYTIHGPYGYVGFVGWKTPTEIKMAWNFSDEEENDDMGGLA